MAAKLPGRGRAAAKFLGDDRRFQRTEAQPHLPRSRGHGLDEVNEPRLSGQIHAVGGNFDPREHQLPVALRGETPRLPRRVLQGQGAQASSGVGDDAVGAEIDAAVLNFQHGACPAADGPGGELFKFPAAEGVVVETLALPVDDRALHGLDKAGVVVRAEDHIRADGSVLLGAELGVTARHADDSAGVFVAQAADGLAGLAPAFGRDGAGVDQHGVRDLAGDGGFVPVRLQQRFHGLGLILVDLAAESGYNVFHQNHLSGRIDKES